MVEMIDGISYNQVPCEDDKVCPGWTDCDTLRERICQPCGLERRCRPPSKEVDVSVGCPMLVSTDYECSTSCKLKPTKNYNVSSLGTLCTSKCPVSHNSSEVSLECVLNSSLEGPHWNQTLPSWLSTRVRVTRTVRTTTKPQTPEYSSITSENSSYNLSIISATVTVIVILFAIIIVALTVFYRKWRQAKSEKSRDTEAWDERRSLQNASTSCANLECSSSSSNTGSTSQLADVQIFDHHPIVTSEVHPQPQLPSSADSSTKKRQPEEHDDRDANESPSLSLHSVYTRENSLEDRMRSEIPSGGATERRSAAEESSCDTESEA